MTAKHFNYDELSNLIIEEGIEDYESDPEPEDYESDPEPEDYESDPEPEDYESEHREPVKAYAVVTEHYVRYGTDRGIVTIQFSRAEAERIAKALAADADDDCYYEDEGREYSVREISIGESFDPEQAWVFHACYYE